MNIVNITTTEVTERFDEQEHYRGAVLRLSKSFSADKLGFHVEVIDPKNFSAPYHYHTGEEEMFLVLEGEAIVRCNDKFHKVVEGDLFFYKTGPDNPHNMFNHTDKPFKFLAISNSGVEDNCHYPDSKKTLTAEGVTQNGVKVDYYKDEEEPAKYWPEYALRGSLI